MAYKTFVAADVLTASDVNTYLMRQSVISCTSATRPASPIEGMTIYETDTDQYLSYSGSTWETVLTAGAWNTGAVSLISGGAGTDWVIGNGTIASKYIKVGRMYVVEIVVTFGSTTTFGTKSLILDNIPQAALPLGRHIGSGFATDSSPANKYPAIAYLGNATQAGINVMAASGTYASGSDVTSTVPITWASGDSLNFTLIYQAAA